MARKQVQMTQEQYELYQILQKEARKANRRLALIEKNFGRDTWAGKRLRNRLESTKIQAYTKGGRVSVRKNMSTMQMKATLKAVRQFLNSKTSTVKGIRETRKQVIEKLKESLRNGRS